MDNTAVVPCLVLPDGLLFFKDDQAQGWKARQHFHGGGESHDPRADDHDVISLFRHAWTPSISRSLCAVLATGNFAAPPTSLRLLVVEEIARPAPGCSSSRDWSECQRCQPGN